ncbi:hypothetical protein AVEN_6241-1 [Araneus ventricosus]|uniref:Uncharacterized protein n=1 Tax=Araneus ventricosus TaxID=182803 RepID=A0A4Y2GPT4_ARAVE|nr:hypothetical protein AVEN_6241-1 [Araneus ventricosus]
MRSFTLNFSRILRKVLFPAWIKIEPVVTQDPMTIGKYLGKESNSKRSSWIKCVPISTLAGSRTSRIILRVQIATSTHAHGESITKRRSRSQNRAQKIASSTHGVEIASPTNPLLYRPEAVNLLTDLAQNFIRTYLHDDRTAYEIYLSSFFKFLSYMSTRGHMTDFLDLSLSKNLRNLQIMAKIPYQISARSSHSFRVIVSHRQT